MPLQYPYLPPDGQHIRLLRLYADEPDSYIRGDLFTCRLAQWDNNYCALSYDWGTSAADFASSVNNQIHCVRINLARFLTNFRTIMRQQGIESVAIFIDAICIDQETTLEKNHQVQMMGTIYSSAERVHAWLGEQDVEIERLFWLLSQWPTEFEAKSPGLESRKRFWQFASQHVDAQTSGRSLSDLFQISYWRRMWVVPECMLARQLSCIVNSTCCNWQHLLPAIKGLEGSSSSMSDLLYGHYRAHNNDTATPEDNFAALLVRFADREASLVLDKAFALIGVLPPSVQAHIQVDYCCSKADLFRQLLQGSVLQIRDVPAFATSLQLCLKDIEPTPQDDMITLNSADFRNYLALLRLDPYGPRDLHEALSTIVDTELRFTKGSKEPKVCPSLRRNSLNINEQSNITIDFTEWDLEVPIAGDACHIGHLEFSRDDNAGLLRLHTLALSIRGEDLKDPDNTKAVHALQKCFTRFAELTPGFIIRRTSRNSPKYVSFNVEFFRISVHLLLELWLRLRNFVGNLIRMVKRVRSGETGLAKFDEEARLGLGT